MTGIRLQLVIIIAFTCFTCFLGIADGYNREHFDDYRRLVGSPVGKFTNNGKMLLLEKIMKRSSGFTPYISVGALSNMHQFFRNLKNNFNSLENLSDDQARALLGSYRHLGECDLENETPAIPKIRARKHSYNQDLRIFRPPATAAYIHATRRRRPSTPIRNFVAGSEPVHLRGSNRYNPSYLWTGLGRKR